MSLIETVNLEKYYNKGSANEVHALKNVSIRIEEGEIIAVMGVSGSGKSTLLNILGFMDSFDSGEYKFEGSDVSLFNDRTRASKRNRSVGFVMQSFGLILSQTALENISIPMLLNKSIRFSEINSRCTKLLNSVGLPQRGNANVGELSGGQQQRVAIARAIANDPKLLIADEPTGSLDTDTAAEIMSLFKKLNREKRMTIILATHDERVSAVCDRVIRIIDGHLLA